MKFENGPRKRDTETAHRIYEYESRFSVASVRWMVVVDTSLCKVANRA